ncbi:MAG: ABC transporter ATP-binding protein [Holophagales bacterium]|nr:ABC transporter ATP-binding protein [Holophagales bacterium]
MKLLEVVDLAAGYPIRSPWTGRQVGWKRVVEDVSFELSEGETLALVGESGSGKTTIARSLLRLIEPRAGVVRFRGEDLARLPAAELLRRRRGLQMVFQDPWTSLNPRMRIADALFEPMRIHGLAGREERNPRVDALLAEVGLPTEVAERYPHELSGGQRQRVGIARALASGPAVLIADEPVSALDVSLRGQILNLLAERQAARGLALLLIAHDLALVARIADRVAVLEGGRIVEQGSVERVLGDPSHPRTRALLAAAPRARPDGADAGGDATA